MFPVVLKEFADLFTGSLLFGFFECPSGAAQGVLQMGQSYTVKEFLGTLHTQSWPLFIFMLWGNT